jgi:hypothetical protein
MANEKGDDFLMKILFGHSDWRKGLDSNSPGLDDEFVRPDAVEKFVEAARSQAVLTKTGAPIVDESWNDWDEPLTDKPLEKRGANPLNFAKGTIGHKWGITRIEEKTIDGERWTYAYAGDDLIDARVIGSLF